MKLNLDPPPTHSTEILIIRVVHLTDPTSMKFHSERLWPTQSSKCGMPRTESVNCGSVSKTSTSLLFNVDRACALYFYGASMVNVIDALWAAFPGSWLGLRWSQTRSKWIRQICHILSAIYRCKQKKKMFSTEMLAHATCHACMMESFLFLRATDFGILTEAVMIVKKRPTI